MLEVRKRSNYTDKFDTSLWPQRAFMRRVTRGVPSPLRGRLALLQPCRALRATPPAQIGPLIAGVGVATVLYGTKLLLEANASGKVQAAVQQAAEGMRRAAAERQAASEKAAAEASRTASRDRAQPDAAGASTADAYFTTAVKLQTSRPSGNGIYMRALDMLCICRRDSDLTPRAGRPKYICHEGRGQKKKKATHGGGFTTLAERDEFPRWFVFEAHDRGTPCMWPASSTRHQQTCLSKGG